MEEKYIKLDHALAFQDNLAPYLCYNTNQTSIFSATRDSDLVAYLQELPTFSIPERATGRWRLTKCYPHWFYCSLCHKRLVPNVEMIEQYNIPTNYCPNCGAKMEN